MSMFRRRLLMYQALMNKSGNIVYPGLIAAWSAKGKTNDDADKAILKDLTGNGHDITLNGFAFSGMSGYDGYSENFDTWQKNTDPNTIFQNTSNTVHITKFAATSSATVYKYNLVANNLKVRVTGLKESQSIVLGDNILDRIYQKFDTDGDYIIPPFTSKGNCSFRSYNIVGECDITIELLPEYPNALVFDGVNDYGVNNNMPILTDYTIIAKREIFGNIAYSCAISKYKGDTNGAFNFDMPNYNGLNSAFSYGYQNYVEFPKNKISWMTPLNYNQQIIKKGTNVDGTNLSIGVLRGNKYFLKFAFYSAYLFDRSLDEQEIKAFIRKYIDPEYLLPSEILTPDCYYDFSLGSNDDENKDTIKDLSGNGNDAVAHNFAWNEDGSGYKDGALIFDGVDDYVSLDAFDSGFKTVFIECSYASLNTILYDQRKVGTEQEDCINTSAYEAGFYGRNKYGKTYINGVYNKPDSTLIASKLSNKHILITSTFKGDYTSTPCIASSNVNKGMYCNIALYKLLGFKEALTEEQINNVIKKYNLLDGVDEIEVS